MIKNDRQHKAAKLQLAKLQKALEVSRKYPTVMDIRLYEAMLAGIGSLIEEIEREIQDFEEENND